MMKKFIIAVCIFSSIAVGRAGILEDNCGCGVGTILFEGHDGVISQTLALTTNGIFWNQLFGVTSGTLGCEPPQSLVSLDKINIFVAGNMDNLAKDIAVGQGETLNTLADLMQVPSDKRGELYTQLRKNFSDIYGSDEVTSRQVTEKIVKIVNS